MIKNFDKFVKESVENKGKGVGGDTDLFPSAPKKSVINRAIPTMDFLRIGKHIQTKKIDGFIDSIQNESIYIADRITGEIKKYTLKEVIKELTKPKEDKKDYPVSGFEGTPAWAKKQKVNEDYAPELEPEQDPAETEVAEEEEFELGSEEEYEEPDEFEIGTEEENEGGDTDQEQHDNDAEPTNVLSNKIKFGTEDNPMGLPNKGNRREMPNESWAKYWNNFDQQTRLINESLESLEEEAEREEEVPIIRGTEDNPLPDRRKTKIESYE